MVLMVLKHEQAEKRGEKPVSSVPANSLALDLGPKFAL